MWVASPAEAGPKGPPELPATAEVEEAEEGARAQEGRAARCAAAGAGRGPGWPPPGRVPQKGMSKYISTRDKWVSLKMCLNKG